MRNYRWFCLILLPCLATPAWAHKPSDSYLRLNGDEEYLTIEWDIALKDLELLVGLDANEDSQITWGELKKQQSAIASHALEHLQLSYLGQTCQLEVTDLLVNRHSDGSYAALQIKTKCPGDAAELELHYSLLFEVDPTHRGLVQYSHADVTSTHVLSPDQASLVLKTGEVGHWNSFLAYVEEGVWHIWIGTDHILFLLTLLVPAVTIRTDKHWEAVESFRPAWTSVLKIVTMFTLAHSITLWLAVMEYVKLPGNIVEATIAFSIVVTAINNLYPKLPLSGWEIAFGFGLVHGFGFANVLLDLGLGSMSLAVSLLGFNVGVELGQLTIVAVFLPLAYLARNTAFYRWIVLRLGSVAVALIASLWMAERVGNFKLLPF